MKFDEKSFPAREWDESSTENSYDSEDDDVTYELSDLYHPDDERKHIIDTSHTSRNDAKNNPAVEQEQYIRCSSRNKKKPERYCLGSTHPAQLVINFPVTTPDEPTVKQALNATAPELQMWKAAINDELQRLIVMKT